MKIVVTRSGGWPPPLRGEADGTELSREQTQALESLFARPEFQAGPGADMFVYKIEVQDETGVRSIIVPQERMPKSLSEIATRR
jgi:hypothetical protein